MASTETPQQGGQPHLQKQDLATLVSVNFSDEFNYDFFVVAWLHFVLDFSRISHNFVYIYIKFQHLT